MKNIRSLVAIFALSAALSSPASAQTSTGNEFTTATPGKSVVGMVEMCINSSNVAVPKDAAGVNCPPSSGGVTPSASATPLAVAASGTTGAVSASLPATASKTNYVCGFDVSAIGGTDPITVTIAGLKGPTTFTYRTSSSVAGATLSRTFTPCIPANAVNGAITAATTAAAGATAVNVNISGYQQ